jgi:hypothetical protein
MVRLWLGHASLNTTHMYIDIDMVKKREILEKSRPCQATIKNSAQRQLKIPISK